MPESSRAEGRAGRGSAGRSSAGRGLRLASTALVATATGLAPLLAGSVHRPAIVAILIIVALAFACGVAGERVRGSALRGFSYAAPVWIALVLPLAQLVPLPTAARRIVDPAGVALLENAPEGLPTFWPASLDPQSTAEEVATAAAALAVFLLALSGATSRRHRRVLLQVIALAGVAAVLSGLGHRIFGIERLYGLFDVFGPVLMGPFINPNHSAELFELAAFAALALAMSTEGEMRIPWYLAAGFSAAAALATMSRGSLLALFAGGATFVALRLHADRDAEPDPSEPKPRATALGRTLGWALGALVCLAAVAVALGATPLLDEVSHTNFTSGTEKTMVWRDAWTVVLRHPLGIGRHAFDRVFPAYKTLRLSSRFEFVESAPLQALIDVGWPGLAALVVGLAWVVRRVAAIWRRDYVAAALVAALAAVAAHNLVDFGLETMGIRLPFVAIAGVLIGRALGRGDDERRSVPAGGIPPGRKGRVLVVSAVAVGLVVGFVAQLRTGGTDLERRWRVASTSDERRTLALEAGQRFPTDYYFPFLQSYDEPLRSVVAGEPSPRLAALNRALRLCPGCAPLHHETARALLGLGRRAQALSSFRDMLRIDPSRIGPALNELERDSFPPAELATMAVGDGPETMAVARYMVVKKAEREALALLADASAKGVPATEVLLVKADLMLELGRYEEAKQALAKAATASPRDARVEAARGLVAERAGQLEEALRHARAAAVLSPFAIEVARQRLNLVVRLQRWSELDEALERLKVALRQNGQNVTEVHMVAGETHAARGNLGRALSEFRTAAAVDGMNPAVWTALARTAEARGDLNGASEAYQRVVVLRPGDPEATQSLPRLEKMRADARLQQMLAPH
jgi:tetratricopeptide (TPR) repeat protein